MSGQIEIMAKMKTLAFLAVFIFVHGCITIPTTENKVLSGEKISDDQLVFIELGVTVKSAIIEHLDPPDIYLIDKNIFVYDWQTRKSFNGLDPKR